VKRLSERKCYFNTIRLRTRKNIKSCFIAVLLFALMQVRGQDIHFSQYNMSPLNLNPAFTGSFDGDYRAGGNIPEPVECCYRFLMLLLGSWPI